MPRPPRNAYPGGFFHAGTRGNSRCRVFLDATDYTVFLMMLDRSERKYNWRIYAWCLMTTHYHLVVSIPDGGLSPGMCELNGSFARWSNLRHEREDHLFGKRFGSIEILTHEHLREACRYVVLNPVRAGMCDDPAEWRWSSYRASAGFEEAPPYLAHARARSRTSLAEDATKAAPHVYKVLFENERARVLEVSMPTTTSRPSRSQSLSAARRWSRRMRASRRRSLAAKSTHGRSVLSTLVSLDDPFRELAYLA